MNGLITLLLVTPAGPLDAIRGTKPIPAARVNPDAVHGFVYQPAFALDKVARPPASPYVPEPGDVLVMNNPAPQTALLYHLAGSGLPSHAGLVVRLPDGSLGVFDAGWNDTLWTRLTPLEWRINAYPGTVWVRKRCVPLTEEQSCRLTAFALLGADRRYSSGRYALQLTPIRSRGPIRTFFLGKPVGEGKRYFCGQAIVEALVYAGLIDAVTARPAVVYPRDLFFDDSENQYLKRHPPLAGGWAPPALWARCDGGCPLAVMPYSAFGRAGVYVPPAELVSDVPAEPNRR